MPINNFNSPNVISGICIIPILQPFLFSITANANSLESQYASAHSTEANALGIITSR